MTEPTTSKEKTKAEEVSRKNNFQATNMVKEVCNMYKILPVFYEGAHS